MTQASTNRPPKIITELARDVSKRLADCLTAVNPKRHPHPLQDQLAVAVMALLSDRKMPYCRELLFRDYAQTEEFFTYKVQDKSYKIEAESANYVALVISKPLTLVAKHKAGLTNTHKLFLMLCHYSVEARWLKALIERRLESIATINETFFNTVAKALKAQCQRQTFGAVSRSVREEYGALYLQLDYNRAEAPEEMSLFDAVKMAATPLQETIKQLPQDFIQLVEHILLSLNEEYGLLRSCGLPPRDFLGKNSLGHFSIGALRELKQLKKAVDEALTANPKQQYDVAYAQAFAVLQAIKRQTRVDQDKEVNVAGFKSFEEFAGSEAGVRMLKTPFIPVDAWIGDVQNFEHFTPSEEVQNEATGEEKFSLENLNDMDWEKFMRDHASHFNPVTAYVFWALIVAERPLNGEDSLLDDPEFCTLVTADESFAHLNKEKLRDTVCQKIAAIIEKHLT